MRKAATIKKALSFKYGGMLPEELSFLYNFCKNRDVIELGSMVGMSSYVIASTCKSLCCVDAWNDRFAHLNHSKRQKDVYRNDWLRQRKPNMFVTFKKNCKVFLNSGKIKMSKGLTDRVYTHFKNKSVDVILIDADHEYSGVLKDIINYAHTLRKNGFMLFHDYGCGTWTGVTEACNQMETAKQLKMISSHKRIAVFQIVDGSALALTNDTNPLSATKQAQNLTGRLIFLGKSYLRRDRWL